MILLISDGAMAKRDVIFHEKHHAGSAQDRHIQNKLLAADDRFEKELLIQLLENASKPKTARSIKEKSEELTGWYHKSSVPLRKPEKGTLIPKGRDGQREFLSWRDSRLKLVPNPRENYVFKHYQDIRYYMKQYREENSILDNNSSIQPPKRVSAFYNTGVYNVAPQPVTREQTSAQIWSRINQNCNQNGTFQYTKREYSKAEGRRDTKRCDKPPSGIVNKYKLVPNVTRADSESSSESEIRIGTSPRKKSANGSKSSSSTPGKSPTKVCVPNTNTSMSGSTVKLSSNPANGSVKVDISPNGSRTLDTLACVAAQEGQPDSAEVEAISPNSETSEAVSIGKLSTTCLGASAHVKQPPKLEASCTYHIFPTSAVLSSSPSTVTNTSSTMMWNPQKSSFERKPAQGGEKDAGMNSPFKKPRSPNGKLSLIRNDKARSKQARDGMNGFPPLTNKLGKGGFGRERTMTLTERKEELNEGEKEPVLKVQSLKSHGRSHSTVGYDEIKKNKKMKSVRTPTQKYCAPASEPRLGSAGHQANQEIPSTGTDLASTDVLQINAGIDDGIVPYFRFWNNGVNRRHLTHSGKGRQWCVDSDLDLKQFAELALLNPDLRGTNLDLSPEKRPHGPPIASGMWFDTNGRAYVSLATRYDPVLK